MESPKYSREDIVHFPPRPGVYRFYNSDSRIIYVGKAKNLKARVASYFNDLSGQNYKTRKMVREVSEIDFILVNTEFDALLLENNLIKKAQPRYNILLKDDKSFPYICVYAESFPRVQSLRNPISGKGRYYGPYTSVRAMKSVLELIRNLYHIRTCALDLSADKIKSGKYKVCLEYHIGKCKGPCTGLQDEPEYLEEVRQAEEILKGNLTPVKQYFREAMQQASKEMAFERAQQMKEKLELLEKFQARTVIVNQNISDVDTFGIVSDDKAAYINYVRIVRGSIVHSQTVALKKKLDEPDDDILARVIVEMRAKYSSTSGEILANIPVLFAMDVEVRVPKIGDKKKLVDLAVKNALYYKKEQLGRSSAEPGRELRILRQLQTDLKLKSLPEHIECFDNSNLQGSNPVASMVCFLKGKPAKKEYRKYHIRTVDGPDDFASMKEIVGRRYGRLLREGRSMPDLVIVDGGKGQLSAACEALKTLGLYGRIPIIGIAKKLEEIYYPGDPIPLHIQKRSGSLNLLQHIRNEAHRFAITFHRQQRSGHAIQSVLTDIDGVGHATAEKLLRHFKSVKKLRAASEGQIAEVVGRAKAAAILKQLSAQSGGV
jgi:excinuclease ABC subunit C